MKIAQMLEIPSLRILLYLLGKGEVRHSELSSLMTSRGTLGLSLRDLEEEGLIQRRVVDTKPIQSFYSLTEKGAVVAKHLKEVRLIISQPN